MTKVKVKVKAKTKTKTPLLTIEEKYKLYEKAVQCPDFDIEFIGDEYKKFYKKAPRVVREDFCGTGLFCCGWVKVHPENRAIGIDLDGEPIAYGKKVHLSELTPGQQKRVQYVQKDVLKATQHKADVVVALNFSYWIFKEREQLLQYFKSVRKSLNKEGFYLIDLFGGTECGQEHVDKVDHNKFIYYWDCEAFNPLTHECLYKIHFKMKKNGKKHEGVFSYDWRFWTMPELKDLLKEAGFSQVHSYWEGEDKKGGGDGNFKITERADNCDSWISYLVALN